MTFDYDVFINEVSRQLNRKVKHVEIAKVLVERGIALDEKKCATALRNRKINKGRLKKDEEKVLVEYFEKLGVEFKNKCPIINQDALVIDYWEGCDYCIQDLKNPLMRPKVADKQLIENIWGMDSSQLCIVAMPGDRMDGGVNPIKDKDVLLIDLSDTNIANSGIFLYTANGNNASIARVSIDIEVNAENNEKIVRFDFDNPNKVPKKYTMSYLEKVNFKVIGRVRENYSRTTY